MNERIKLLAEQAKKYALDAMIKITDKEQALKLYSASYDTKFAELIVRECGVALSPMLRDMVSRGQAYNLIKQHLGVEE